jgi:hypothetical protein
MLDDLIWVADGCHNNLPMRGSPPWDSVVEAGGKKSLRHLVNKVH